MNSVSQRPFVLTPTGALIKVTLKGGGLGNQPSSYLFATCDLENTCGRSSKNPWV